MNNKKLCFVVQRYGLEVNGGAELQCRQFAEHMRERYKEIHVVTTKAVDYMTWKNEYVMDEEEINGIYVHRFGVTHPRDQKIFDEVNGRFFAGTLRQEEEFEWMEKQGPACPDLVKYLKENKDNFAAFIFFTYLYYTTAMGLPEVYEKAILIPEAHDDPFYSMHIFDDVFKKPRGILFNTFEEQKLIHNIYHNEHIPYNLGGVGVELPPIISEDSFKRKYNLEKYILYVGRIDVSKNCDMLFHYFDEYKKNNDNSLKLVLMGKNGMKIPERDDILNLGFVDEQEKYDGMKGASLLVLPSEFESLSMVVLEAMSVFTSVMVYGKCDVLRGHCIKSNGALYFNNFYEFEQQVNYLLDNDNELIVSNMKKNAYNYVQENYQWDIIMDRLQELIEVIR